MEKIQLGKWTIRTAASLRRKILFALNDGATKNDYYWQLVGIYDTRIFGLVFYRNGNYDFDSQTNLSLRSQIDSLELEADKLRKQLMKG